ncbi:PAS domain-containing protein [Massilia sp. Dwa41.01b]|nr:PAS domain-containing protein [Massilia sp. Dwa41.01b]
MNEAHRGGAGPGTQGDTSPASPMFLSGGGQMGALMRAHDWSASPLGVPSGWPQALRTVVSLMLNSKFPMFCAWGEKLAFLYNDAYIDVLGGKHPAALGEPFGDIWAEIWAELEPLSQRALDGEATYFEKLPLLMRRHGYDEQTWFTFSYSPVRNDDGAIAGVYCACVEVTGQVHAERYRDEENKRLVTLFEQAPGIIAVLRGPEHVFEITNKSYMQLIGRTDLVGKTAREALPYVEGQGFFELLDHVYSSGKPFVGHAVPFDLAREPGGPLERRYLDFIYQPIRDPQGQVVGIFVEGSDVTPRKQIEDELRAANRQKDQFLAMLAHELRNPLAPITTAAHLLKMGTLEPGAVRNASEIIARQAEHMTDLVNDLLDVSRVTRGLVELEKEELDVNAVVSGAVEQARPLIEGRRHALTLQLSGEPVHVLGDRTRLVQVLSNVLNNAAKYTPVGGQISLRVDALDTEVVVTVRDNGIGIEPDVLPYIFDLFTQAERTPDRSQGGLGIGLALVRAWWRCTAAAWACAARRRGRAANSRSACGAWTGIRSRSRWPKAAAMRPGSRPCASWWSTTTRTRRRCWQPCSKCRAMRCRSPTTARARCGMRASSARKSCCSISACPIPTAMRWRASCAPFPNWPRRPWWR